jgi:hypothetical protein
LPSGFEFACAATAAVLAYHKTTMPSGNPLSRATALPIREDQGDDAQRRLDAAAEVVFRGERPSEDDLIAAAVLRMTFPRVAPERLREAADVLVTAMSGPYDEINPDRLDSAAAKIADVFAAE